MMATMMSTLLVEAHSLENPVASDRQVGRSTKAHPHAHVARLTYGWKQPWKKKITCPLPRHGSIMPYDVTKSDHFTHRTLAVGFVFDFFFCPFLNFFWGERGFFFFHSLFSYENKYPASIIFGSTLLSPEFILSSYFRTYFSIPSSILAIIWLSILDLETW